MPVTKLRSIWNAGNLRFVKSSDLSAICDGIVAVSGSTTKGSGTLPIPITARVVAMTTGGSGEALTLADGAPGQELLLYLATDGGGDGTLTPTTKTGFATIVFADAGDQAILRYVDDTLGWVIVGLSGTAAPPAFTV
jgi:hypothetical protein